MSQTLVDVLVETEPRRYQAKPVWKYVTDQFLSQKIGENRSLVVDR